MRADRFIARAFQFTGEFIAIGGRRASVGWDIFQVGKYPLKIGNPPTAVGNATTTIGKRHPKIEKRTTAVGNEVPAIGNGTTPVGNGTVAVGKRTAKIGKLEFLTGKSLFRIGKTIFPFINPAKTVETVQPPSKLPRLALSAAAAPSGAEKTLATLRRELRSGKSGGGPPQSKTLARFSMTHLWREASWSAPVLWRFGRRCNPVVAGNYFGWTCRAGAQRRRVMASPARTSQPGAEGWNPVGIREWAI